MVTTSITESVLSLILSQIVCNLRLICTLTVFLTESILSSIMYDVNFSWQPSVKLNPSSCNLFLIVYDLMSTFTMTVS